MPEDRLKKELFVPIRDAILAVKPDSDIYQLSPVFKKFTDRHIIKLDYNENDRVFKDDIAHAGKFRRPERVAINRKFGQIYRLQTAKKADDISSGAVTEALANDLSRIMGVPTQDLRIVRGKYSDGHPKIMLEAKFADGYKDFESGFIKNGQIVKPKNYQYELEKLGKYKAFFLVTADRDGIGSRGQNKGFAKGKFFAIDPGHSLEGNGKYLTVEDNLSFKDTFGYSTKPRFNNFSVFDDDTRFAKLQGVVMLREVKNSGAVENLFREYKRAFNPLERGISSAESELRKKIITDIESKEKEFNYSLQKILNVSDSQLHLYDDLSIDGPQTQQNAIETIENLEKLTSPTTWVSKDGTVPLEHLQVLPESRVAWNAHVDGDNIVYNCDEPLSLSARKMLEAVAVSAHGELKIAADGTATLKVSRENREAFFKALSEENVMKLTHAEEAAARKFGGNGLLEAKNYKSPLIEKTPVNNRHGNGFVIPDTLTIMVRGVKSTLVKKQYETMIKETLASECPKSVEELKAVLEARIDKGNSIIRDVLHGKGYIHKCTPRNAACMVLALHAISMTKGEYLERGSFSIEDPDGRLYQWLNTSKELYLRTSTHAKTYHHDYVDGHMNMPRGFDIPSGMGGLFGDMKTFHFFAVPGIEHPQQSRRLFLKPETHGIYHSTIKAEEIEKSLAPGMQTRPTVDGDWRETLLHCGSLLTSISRLGESDGNRKENVPKTILKVMNEAKEQLQGEGFAEYAQILDRKVGDGNGGLRVLAENIQSILRIEADKLRQEQEGDLFSSNLKQIKMVGALTSIFAAINDFIDQPEDNEEQQMVNQANAPQKYARGGNQYNRIGNEVMIESYDMQL